MEKEAIVFMLSTFFSQEQNIVFVRMRKTPIKITRTHILEENIKDGLWSNLVLAMTYIKNSRLIRALANNFISIEYISFENQTTYICKS